MGSAAGNRQSALLEATVLCCPDLKPAEPGISFVPGNLELDTLPNRCQPCGSAVRNPVASWKGILLCDPWEAFPSCLSSPAGGLGTGGLEVHPHALSRMGRSPAPLSTPTCFYRRAIFTEHEKDQYVLSTQASRTLALCPLLLPCSHPHALGRMTAIVLFRTFASRPSCANPASQLPGARWL